VGNCNHAVWVAKTEKKLWSSPYGVMLERGSVRAGSPGRVLV